MNDKKKTTKDDTIDPLVEKMEKLENELLATQEKLEEAEAAKIRALADLQNFQRRQSEEKAQWHASSVISFITPFLPRFLELQMGISHSKDEDAKKVVEKFFESLQGQGLVKIEPQAGDTIDTNLHEVLMVAEGEAGKIVKMLEPGWKFGVTVIKPAKVSAATE